MGDGRQTDVSERQGRKGRVHSTTVKVEDVVGSHIEDPVTFWGQSIELIQDLLKMSSTLTEMCPFAAKVFGDPIPEKIYGGLYTEDQCWYRCKLKKVMANEKCLMMYVDYGNSETLNKSCIVELSEDLQHPGLASKYRLWGLRVPPKQEVVPFEQGRKFLASLINDKIIRISHRDRTQDGTFLVDAKSDSLNIGQEVLQKGFAENCEVVSNHNLDRLKTDANLSIAGRNAGRFSSHSLKVKNVLESRNVHLGINSKHQMHSGEYKRREQRVDGENVLVYALEKKSHGHVQKHDVIRVHSNQKRLENQNERLREKNIVYLRECRLLETQLIQQQRQLKKMEEELKWHQEAELKLADEQNRDIEMKFKRLAEKVQKLKQVRSELNVNRFGNDLVHAMKVMTEGRIHMPRSMKHLENVWNEYNFTQETLKKCNSLGEVHDLIDKRNEMRNKLYAAAQDFTSEVDMVPIRDRVNVLKHLTCTLSSVYSPYESTHSSDTTFDQFIEWRDSMLQESNNTRDRTAKSLQVLSEWFDNTAKFFELESGDSWSSEEDSKSVKILLDEAEHDVDKEIEMSIAQSGEADNKIIRGAFNEVMQKIEEEQDLLSIIERRHADSVQFKEQVGHWFNTSPNVEHLLSIRSSVKNLKAQLRWKLVEKNNIEDLGYFDDVKTQKIKEEIQKLRDEVHEEIYCERKEYERLANIVQNWFPELALLHPEAAIKSYMQSAGLLNESLERCLFDREPLRELSSKRSVVCSEVKSRRILLKGYSVDYTTEAYMIERAAEYHRAWSVLNENSGLLRILGMFVCKSEPVAYVLVPFYPGCSLKEVQDTNPLNSVEIITVMRDVAVGLQTLHGSNIVHGALHPHNVFVINRQCGIVGDFDFTKTPDQRSKVSWMVAGKLDLVAPEIRSGHSADSASDMFAYGNQLLWLNFSRNDFTVNLDGTVDLSELSMDPKLWSLVLRLTCCSPVDRLRAEQLIEDDYFQTIKTDSIQEVSTSTLEENHATSILVNETNLELPVKKTTENLT
ncbi:serine/threonine-protein kinase 31 isoform X1 [Hemitrygon akajei]|uniref:serine/threonine-protein kinase 31 isoform X1 n=1 Tax=Hemitrygon akajei TaxID=2704970 RepID=UPI003BF9B685